MAKEVQIWVGGGSDTVNVGGVGEIPRHQWVSLTTEQEKAFKAFYGCAVQNSVLQWREVDAPAKPKGQATKKAPAKKPVK